MKWLFLPEINTLLKQGSKIMLNDLKQFTSFIRKYTPMILAQFWTNNYIIVMWSVWWIIRKLWWMLAMDFNKTKPHTWFNWKITDTELHVNSSDYSYLSWGWHCVTDSQINKWLQRNSQVQGITHFKFSHMTFY